MAETRIPENFWIVIEMETKAKSKQTKKSTPSAPEVSIDEQSAILSKQILDLERVLQDKSNAVKTAYSLENESREHLALLQEKERALNAETMAIACDHTRMYKTLQTEMIRKIEDMEATLETQASEKEICQQSIKDLIEEKEGVTLRKLKRSQKLLESKVGSITLEFEKMVTVLTECFESHTRRLELN